MQFSNISKRKKYKTIKIFVICLGQRHLFLALKQHLKVLITFENFLEKQKFQVSRLEIKKGLDIYPIKSSEHSSLSDPYHPRPDAIFH